MDDQQLKVMFEGMNTDGYGSSAKAITSNLFNTGAKKRDAPYDLGDFSRCYHVVENIPFLKNNLQKMALVSPRWKLVIEHWDKLCYCYENKEARNARLIFRIIDSKL